MRTTYKNNCGLLLNVKWAYHFMLKKKKKYAPYRISHKSETDKLTHIQTHTETSWELGVYQSNNVV